MGKEASFADMILWTSHVSLLRRTPLAAFLTDPGYMEGEVGTFSELPGTHQKTTGQEPGFRP
jgi:hypothetical protein